MGTPFIFWINEEPVRQQVSQQGRTNAVVEEVGEKIIRLATERNMQALAFSGSFGVFCADKHMKDFFSSGMPLPDWSFFSWTGTRLESLPYMTAHGFDDLCQLVDKAEGSGHVIGGSEEAAPISHAVASIYWLYEPFASDLAYMARDKWPCIEMGRAVLSLLLDGETHAAVLNHHPGICRACSLVDHQGTALAWGQNWLGCLAHIPPEGRSRLREILAAR